MLVVSRAKNFTAVWMPPLFLRFYFGSRGPGAVRGLTNGIVCGLALYNPFRINTSAMPRKCSF